MQLTIEYSDLSERERILEEHKDKYLIEEQNIQEGNFLVFTITPPLEVEINIVKQAIAELSMLFMGVMGNAV